MKLYIASDHAGYLLKRDIIDKINSVHFIDLGCDTNKSTDYPDYAHKLCGKISGDDRGILICGSGNGVAMSANKHKNVRAALCWNKEIATLAVEHNNANILTLGARVVGPGVVQNIVKEWLKTPFGGGRHENRVKKIIDIEMRYLRSV